VFFHCSIDFTSAVSNERNSRFGFSMNIGFTHNIPLRDVKRDFKKLNGYNMSMDLFFVKSRFSVGFDFFNLHYDREKLKYIFKTIGGTEFGDSELIVRSAKTMLFFTSKVYLYDEYYKPINPYLCVGIGPSRAYTKMSLETPIVENMNLENVNINIFSNTVFTSKVSLGFLVDVTKLIAPNKDRKNKLSFILNLESGFLIASNFKYVRKIERDFLDSYNYNSLIRFPIEKPSNEDGSINTIYGEIEDFISGSTNREKLGDIYQNKYRSLFTNVTIGIKF